MCYKNIIIIHRLFYTSYAINVHILNMVRVPFQIKFLSIYTQLCLLTTVKGKMLSKVNIRANIIWIIKSSVGFLHNISY